MNNSAEEITKMALEVIDKEASAVANLKNYVDKVFSDISLLIFN